MSRPRPSLLLSLRASRVLYTRLLAAPRRSRKITRTTRLSNQCYHTDMIQARYLTDHGSADNCCNIAADFFYLFLFFSFLSFNFQRVDEWPILPSSILILQSQMRYSGKVDAWAKNAGSVTHTSSRMKGNGSSPWLARDTFPTAKRFVIAR